MKRFDGKVAIVTGAGCVGTGWGNGRATAVRFAEEGARVVAVDREPERLAETLERAGALRESIHVAQCDVTDSKSVAAVGAGAVKVVGRGGGLVNNVGGSAGGGTVAMREEGFDAPGDPQMKKGVLTPNHRRP